MTIKDFLKPSWKKIVVTIIIFLSILAITATFGTVGGCAPGERALTILNLFWCIPGNIAGIYYTIAVLLLLGISYLISCVLVKSKPREDKK
jgi:hypothetical protein